MTKRGKRWFYTVAIVWIALVIICVIASEGRPVLMWRVARVLQWCAAMIGQWGLAAENEYHRLTSLERMN